MKNLTGSNLETNFCQDFKFLHCLYNFRQTNFKDKTIWRPQWKITLENPWKRDLSLTAFHRSGHKISQNNRPSLMLDDVTGNNNRYIAVIIIITLFI